MSDVILYGSPQSTYVRSARMALAEKAVDYTLDSKIELASDDYRKLHPFSKMPAFRHGAVALFETAAICRYVDEAFGELKLQPGDAAARAEMTQWISAVIDYIYPAMARELIFPRIVAPARGQPVDEVRVSAAMPEIERQLDILNGALAGKTWLAGEAFSLADIMLAPILFYVGLTPEGQDALPRRSSLTLWKSRVSDRESFVATLPPRD